MSRILTLLFVICSLCLSLAAQGEMWKQQQWQAPYYWAAFVLQGEWK